MPPSNCPACPPDAKVALVHDACQQRDVAALRTLGATHGGFVTDELRRAAWPILLGCSPNTTTTTITPAAASTDSPWPSLPPHRDEDQVELDVNRSFIYYPKDESEKRLTSRKRELLDLITAVLRRHPMLSYFQGYHDIVQVLLLVLGAQAAEPALARLSLLYIRDFMLPSISATYPHLDLLPAILYAVDHQLYYCLAGAAQPTPFFALPATLTLYAHDIEEYGDIARLFDYLLVTEAAVPVYLFASIVISRKKELLEVDHNEPEMIHSILSKLPKPLDLEDLIFRTQTLFELHPPYRLPFGVWRRVSSHSTLKTTRNPKALASQTLQEGERHFQKHAAEIRRQESLTRILNRTRTLAYKYRRPVKWSAAAILVAILALYFRPADRTTTTANLGALFSNLIGRLRNTTTTWADIARK